MSTAPPSLPMAGDFLVATFADMMHATRFRKHVWSKMQLAERRRLESLRLQALYGDAPDNNSSSSGNTTASAATGQRSGARTLEPIQQADGTRGQAALPGKTNVMAKNADDHPAAPSPSCSPPQPSPPRWFDIAGQARYNAWVALRGCMTADVAAECFCAEFLGLVKKYPHPTLLAPVEAALSTAQGLAQRARSGGAPARLIHHHTTAAPAPSSAAATTPTLHVRALQGDPAALALLWLCRAYRIPCEFVVEPLSKALGTSALAHPTTARPGTINPYLPYTLADACYPFAATLTYPAAGAASSSGPKTAAAAATATVTTPEAAFVLMADTFLSAYPHWMGVPSDLFASVSSTAPSSSQLLLRCGWIDELQHITRHVRTPLLALLVHQATQSSSSSSSPSSSGRQTLLHAVAAHLHRYESWTMERVAQRRVGQALSVLSPLLASTAVVNALQRAYAPDAKAVTAADVFVASCGYVLCTHPFCADVFPLLHVPTEAESSVRVEWPQARAAASAGAAATTPEVAATYAPWGLPLYLSGLPAECNEMINRVLRRESKGATKHEQRQQSVRLLLNDRIVVGSSSSSSNSSKAASESAAVTAASPSSPQQQRNAAYFAVSSASFTKEAAEAVGQLILARLHSLCSDDLHRGTPSHSTSSVSGVPFLVLGHVLALTWSLAQEQVPAFPYFMLDGNPEHFGGFSFLDESTLPAGTTATSGAATQQRSRRCFQVSLAPAAASSSYTAPTAGGAVGAVLPTIIPVSTGATSASSSDGGVSIESRLRSGLQAVTTALLRGTRRLSRGSKDDEAASSSGASGVHATHVLRSAGGVGASAASL